MTKRHVYYRPALIVALAACSVGAASLPGDKSPKQMLPPVDQTGQCYAQVFVPPTFEKSVVQQAVSDGIERIEKIPAKYEMEERTVLVKDPYERIEVVPAVYDWIEEKVMVQPATERFEVVPAVYETITEKVVDVPAHSVWKKGTGPLQRLDHATGDIVCLVQVPTTYKTVQKRVLKQPATTRTVKIPAQYKILKKRVLITPESTRKVMVPGEYKTVKVKKLVEPARFTHIVEPPKYREITKQVKVKNGRLEWQPVLCQTNMSPAIIRSIQEALKQANFNPGPVDGVLGSKTIAAVESYQKERGLPVGSLTLQTIKSLGVTLSSVEQIPGLHRESKAAPNLPTMNP